MSLKILLVALVGMSTSAQALAQAPAQAQVPTILRRAAVGCETYNDCYLAVDVVLALPGHSRFVEKREFLPVDVTAKMRGVDLGLFAYLSRSNESEQDLRLITNKNLNQKPLRNLLGSYKGAIVGASCLVIGVECTVLRNANGVMIRILAATIGLNVTASYLNLTVSPVDPKDPRWSIIVQE